MKISDFKATLILAFLTFSPVSAQVYIRLNQAGYLPGDNKIAVAFSDKKVMGIFKVTDLKSGQTVLEAPLQKSEQKGWGNFKYYFMLDFSQVNEPGRYRILIPATGSTSQAFSIGDNVYETYAAPAEMRL
jgi:endoglucanase